MTSAAEITLATAAEVAALPEGGALPSPCISVCRMDAQSGLCEGCFRNLDEIAAWGMLADAQKRDVWKLIATRAAS